MININIFNWRQMFNDAQGKTQAVLFCGVWGCLVALIGLILSIGITTIMVVGKLEKDQSVINFLSGVQNTCFALFGVAFTGLTAQTFSKDKPVNTSETVDLPKPAKTVTEINTEGMSLKETTTEFKVPDQPAQ